MTPKAFKRSLRAFVRRRRFLPFQVEFFSGDVIRVGHPEAVRIRGSVVLFVSPTGHQRLFDGYSVCQLRDDQSDGGLSRLASDGP